MKPLILAVVTALMLLAEAAFGMRTLQKAAAWFASPEAIPSPSRDCTAEQIRENPKRYDCFRNP
ncbi:hypothetical protein [Solimonas sp. SE-A11]|uniref:hypothetical protein n=1 Tax=Solimonas sp. SE-A11 TaxID=3054954 RepID=UPI00259CC1ED|nr:hypothetical protein [Solimonas sp. SE-A11]MDM4772939.1 hypothetical protein [Solimonas sp. SE-A11]